MNKVDIIKEIIQEVKSNLSSIKLLAKNNEKIALKNVEVNKVDLLLQETKKQQLALFNARISKEQLKDVCFMEERNNKIDKLTIDYKKLIDKKYKLCDDLGLNIRVNYNCNKCDDTGFNKNGTTCKCILNKYYKKLKEFSGISEPEENINFINYNRSIISKDLKAIFANIYKNYNSKNILLVGNVGCGKTYYFKCLYNNIKSQNKVFIPLYKLLDLFIEIEFGKDYQKKEYIKEILYNSKHLFIDDLGANDIRDKMINENLLKIIDYRLDNNKLFYISTNFDREQLTEKYSERLSSRIADKNKTNCYGYNGKDLRRNY